MDHKKKNQAYFQRTKGEVKLNKLYRLKTGVQTKLAVKKNKGKKKTEKEDE